MKVSQIFLSAKRDSDFPNSPINAIGRTDKVPEAATLLSDVSRRRSDTPIGGSPFARIPVASTLLSDIPLRIQTHLSDAFYELPVYDVPSKIRRRQFLDRSASTA